MRILILSGGWKNFRPVTLTRPLAEIRAGAFTFRERIERLFPGSSIAVLAPDAVAKAYSARTGIAANRLPDGDGQILVLEPNAIYGNSFRKSVEDASPGTRFVSGDETVAMLGNFDKIPEDLKRPDFAEIEVDATVIPAIWDLVNMNGGAISHDFENFFSAMVEGNIHPLGTIYEPSQVYIAPGAELCAGAVLDSRNGPIILAKNSIVRPGAVVEGPCYIGENSIVVSGWIRPACSFGPVCRVGGEIESSVFQSFSNKYHEGFVGHSYIGEWVNLGALTTTSDLKNNYGEIRVDMGEGQIKTGRIKIGSFIGDHAKTGIGALLNSGTFIGVSVNHYGAGLPPKHVPDFSWGGAEGYVDYDIEKAIATAKTVMSRRGLQMLPEEEALLRSIAR